MFMHVYVHLIPSDSNQMSDDDVWMGETMQTYAQADCVSYACVLDRTCRTAERGTPLQVRTPLVTFLDLPPD